MIRTWNTGSPWPGSSWFWENELRIDLMVIVIGDPKKLF